MRRPVLGSPPSRAKYLSPHTLEAYARDIGRMREFLGGEASRPAQVLPIHVARWLRGLSHAGLSASSQGRALSSIRRFFAYLVVFGVVDDNPARSVPAPKRLRPNPVTITRAEAIRLVGSPDMKTARGQRDRAVLELVYASGLKASEACRLRLDELHMELGLVRPHSAGRKERVVPVGGPAQETLQRYLAEGRAALLRGRLSEFVFIGNRGRPITRMTLFNLVRRYAIRVGITKPISPDTLRHSFATHLLQGGAELHLVQEMLGHADISTTEIYSNVDTKQLRGTVDAHHPLGGKGTTNGN